MTGLSLDSEPGIIKSSFEIEFCVFMKRINIRTLDLNLLRVLVALADTRSVSHAADQIGMSQPATSNALGRLRDATGDPLFQRTKAGMLPTPYAQEILPGVRQHLTGLFDSLTAPKGFDPATSERRFRISLSGLGELLFLPRLLDRVLRTAPHVRLINRPVPTNDLSDVIERGEIDCAMGLFQPEGRGLRSVALYEETFVFVAGRGLTGPINTMADLAQADLVISAPKTSYGRDITQLIQNNGLAGSVKLELANFGVLPMLLDTAPLVALVPERLAQEMMGTIALRIVPVQIPQPKQSVHLVWHDHSDTDAGCTWLRDQVQDLFQAKGPA